MKQQYKTTDRILSSLRFKKPEKIRIVIDDKNVRLYIGPRESLRTALMFCVAKAQQRAMLPKLIASVATP